MRKFFSVAAIAALILSLGSCKKDEPTNYKFADGELEDFEMYEGEDYVLLEPESEKVLPAIEGYTYQADDRKLFTATSDDEEVVSVTVSNAGDIIFHALKKGEAMITVTFTKLNVTGSFYVTVLKDEPYFYRLDNEEKFGVFIPEISLKMHSGKDIDGAAVTYSLYYGGSLMDAYYSYSETYYDCAFDAYLPGEFTFKADYDGNTYEKVVKVSDPAEMQVLTPGNATADQFVGTWTYVSETGKMRRYEDGKLVSDTTMVGDPSDPSVAGFRLTEADNLLETMKKDGTFNTTAYKWQLADGYLNVSTALELAGGWWALGTLLSGISNVDLCRLGTLNVYSLTDATTALTDKGINYAYSFDATSGNLILKSTYIEAGRKNDGGYTQYILLEYESVSEYAKK